MKRKLIAALCCTTMLLASTTVVNAAYADGKTQGTAAGLYGDVTVEVTVEGEQITAIDLIETNETDAIWNTAWPAVPDAIIEAQSTDVDTVSGATYASTAIINAVKVALGEMEAEVKEEAVIPESADVIIVGGGGAGLTAAISAAQEGASVVLFEKEGALGGNTLIAGQGFNAADPERQGAMELDSALVETLKGYLEMDPADCGDYGDVLLTVKDQINAYLESGDTYLFDSPELHMLHCYLGGTRTGIDGTTISPDVSLVEVLAKNADAALDWLESIGGQWKDTTSTILGAMWPRSHGLANGNVITILQAAAEENGVQIFVNADVKELVTTDGAVTGVVVECEDGSHTVAANKGVVLATGGYSGNAEMVAKYNNYWPGLSSDMATTNAHGITGDGIVMAEAVGADLVGMGFVQLMPSSHPVDGSLFTGVWGSAETQLFVNQEGVRYVNEYAERDVLAKAALEQTNGLFYIICDNDIVSTVDPDRLASLEESGCIYVADTLEELAEKMGVPVDDFVATVNTYNEYTVNKNDPDFGKELFGEPIDEAPFTATPRSPSLHHTMGGVKIDTEAHVINTDGEIISGLYAAGEVCGGVHGGNRLGGNAMTDFLVFGNIAGTNAAAE